MPLDPQASIANELPSIINVSQNGWSPVLALKDRENEDLTISTVFQVINWVGGIAKKPAIGAYIGSTGLVIDINDAVDVKGSSGTIQTTVSTLRLLSILDSSIFYVSDLGGIFIVDTSDTTSDDDGLYTIVTANSKRIKKRSLGSGLTITSVSHSQNIY